MKIAKLPLSAAVSLTVVTALVVPAAAQQSKLTDSQTATVLRQLEELQRTLNGSKSSNNSKAVTTFTQAASSGKLALELYLNCIKAENFEKEEKRESDFRDWKNRSEDLHKSNEFQLVLRMQLLYLVATIRAAEADEVADALPAIENFLSFYLQLDKLLLYPEDLKRGSDRLREVARTSILQTPFAKHFKLNATVTPPADWPLNPTEIDNLFDAVILPIHRQEKDATALAAAWDARIAHQKNLALAHREEEAIRRLNAIGEDILPKLEWGKARDTFEFGNQATGAAAMIAVVKANLSHPEAGAWLDELTALVKNEADPAESTTGDATPPSPEDPQPDSKRLRDLIYDTEN